MTEFTDNLSMVMNTANQKYKNDFKNMTYASGGVVEIKIPGYPGVQTGLAVTAIAIQDLTVAYTLTENDIYNVPYNIDLLTIDYNIVGADKALTDMQSQAIVDNYAYPAFCAIEQALETNLSYLMLTNAWYSPIDSIAKLGAVNSFPSVQSMNTMLTQLQLKTESRVAMFNTADAASIANSLQNSFNTALNTKISPEGFVGGSADKGRLAGLDMMQSNNFSTHVAGPLGGRTDLTVVSVASDGLSITLNAPGDTSTGALILAGDRFAFTTIKWVQPVGKQVLNYNVTLCAAQNADGDGAGNVVLYLSYPIMPSGFQANVSALPAPGAPVQCFPDFNVNYAYVDSALSVSPLGLHDIVGAFNSEKRISIGGKTLECPTKVMIQGLVTAGNNTYRISQVNPMKVFTPYIIALPSLAA